MFGTGCPVYPDSPLFGGGAGLPDPGIAVQLEPGAYQGLAVCTQFFQTRGRPPALDSIETAVELMVSEQGGLFRQGLPVNEQAELSIDLGIFRLDRDVVRIDSVSGELVVSLDVSVRVRSDGGDFLELAGPGSETFRQEDGDHVRFGFATELTTVDPSQQVMDMAFECSASLERR